jgi:uncharacterized protein YndB with AHSA1/START domain
VTVTSVHKDTEALTMTITAEYSSPVDRVWQLWADPRLLEKWWGPPTYPATFEEHDLSPGGTVTYYMTGPEGDQPRGWWRVTSVDAPNRLEFQDGFSDDDGNPNPEFPTMTMVVTLTPTAAGSRMKIETTFESAEGMEQILAMGMEEGMKEAVGQIDDLLAA